MSDLTDFLLARIADDETWSRRDAERASAWMSEHQGSSVAFHRFHLHRVLAECEAKRRIIAACRLADSAVIDGDARVVSGLVLDALALPYADHPDYREEWKP